MSSAAPLVRAEGTAQHPKGVRCLACGHRCFIPEGRAGVCQVRFNRDGELRAPFGYAAGIQADPIEKKPFFHAFPGRDAFSFGMMGCDYHCGYCQNWVTSQALRDDKAVASPQFVDAQELVSLALENDCPVMVSTYNEPLITSDWAVEIFKLARQQGIVCGFVSNGNATPEVLEYIRPYVDLYKVDLKSFNDKSYRQLGGILQNVLDTIRRLKQMEFWVEVVTLVVPGFNDSDDELREIADFLARVSVDIPWHVTSFHPDYKMTDPPPTSVETLLRAYEIGKSAGLRFVYPGNLPGRVGSTENTYCPTCKTRLIERHGFVVTANHMSNSQCPNCECGVAGKWEELLTFAALRLGRKLGDDIQEVLSAKERNDVSIRIENIVDTMVSQRKMHGTIRIPNTVGDIDITVNLESRQVEVSVSVDAPKTGRSTTRVNWLLRQLKSTSEKVRLDSWGLRARTSLSEMLGSARKDPSLLIPPENRDITRFAVTLTRPMGLKRSGTKDSFIDSVLSTLDDFYGDVVQHLKEWQPAAPKLQKIEVEEDKTETETKSTSPRDGDFG
ncbi:MAG: AmmeMemoRadiSam system radical SAM enzyme, partial [Planctomycetes bacterium]|nr:AmmeMemoRadiSam system radical SAM enzyme [Planctomycetota bacterium]